MGCVSCAVGGISTEVKTGGCGSSSGGCSSGGCSTGGCNKMNSFDWLRDMDIPLTQRYDVVEVRFKGGRKEYFRNINQLDLTTGDMVACEMANGYHIGMVSLQGDLVRLQLRKKNIGVEEEVKGIYRIASVKDLEKHTQGQARDLPTMYRTREIIRELKLNMKLSDVEYQSDNTKATFYYSSEERVDFRELIKLLANEFKVRVEMRQISLRQEASRLGGIGSCGRELCCSTWLSDFKNISTSAARYQNLSLNPAKLSGQCGRLKCCLNYELETYVDALKEIPTIDVPLKTKAGDATLQKTDIFRKIMWFGFDRSANWHPVAIHKVLEIVELNKKGILPESLDNLEPAPVVVPGERTIASLNSDLENLDRKYAEEKRKKGRNDRNRKKNRPAEGASNSGPAATQAQQPKVVPASRPERQNKPGGQANQSPRNAPQNSKSPNSEGGQPRRERPARQGGHQNPPKRVEPNAAAAGGEGAQPNANQSGAGQSNPNKRRNHRRRPQGGKNQENRPDNQG